MNWEIIAVIGGLLLILFIYYLVVGKRKTWYSVLMANPEMTEIKVYRTTYDRLWALDAPAFMLFRREDGQIIKINKKWIIKIETIGSAK